MLFLSLTKMFFSIWAIFLYTYFVCVSIYTCPPTYTHWAFMETQCWHQEVSSITLHFLEQCVSMNLTLTVSARLSAWHPRDPPNSAPWFLGYGLYRTLCFLTRGSRIQAVFFRLAEHHSTYRTIYLVLVYPHCNNGVRVLNFSQSYGENGIFRHF